MDRIFVGTFHKTGTVLMHKLWRRVANVEGLGFVNLGFVAHRRVDDWGICFAAGSRFGDLPQRFPQHRGLLCTRDPRDVIVSAARYHATAKEKALHLPDDRFDGQTYQQAINALPEGEARLIFELRHRSRATIESMLRTTAAHPDFVRTRLEWLVTDYELVEWRRIFLALGFPEARLKKLLSLARAISAFNPDYAKRRDHIRGQGPGEWQAAFTPSVLAEYAAIFPDAAERLGYPP